MKQPAGKLTESDCMESPETPGKLEVRANFRSKSAHLQATEISITKPCREGKGYVKQRVRNQMRPSQKKIK